MKIKVLRSWCLGKGVDTVIGETIDLPDREARIKINQGKARPTRGKITKITAPKAPLFSVEESLELIAKAQTVEDLDEIMEGDTREETSKVATAKYYELKGDPNDEK